MRKYHDRWRTRLGPRCLPPGFLQSNPVKKALRRAARLVITLVMARYISQHTIACLTRQALQAIIAELKRDETVRTIRCVSDSLEGKLLCEFEAPDKETV